MKDNDNFLGGTMDSNRVSKMSQTSQKSIITNIPEKPVTLAGSKASKG